MVFHPSVSMLTEMTHLTLSPGSPGLPTVFITRRMISSALSESENLYFGFLRYTSASSLMYLPVSPVTVLPSSILL